MGNRYKYTDAVKYDFTNGKIFRKRRINSQWEEIGSPNERGALRCTINGKTLMVHRILYEKYHCVELTRELDVDHIDRNPSNNKISNLRVVSRQQNMQNTTHHKDSTTKQKNIYWHKQTNKYQVRIQVDRKFKHFGLFNTIEDAIKKRDEMYIELNKQGYIFSC